MARSSGSQLLGKVSRTLDRWMLRFQASWYGNRLAAPLITRGFHKLFYANDRRTWFNTTWLGVPVLKCPTDLWVYQEIIHRVRPDAIIECGTYDGGSAFYLASLLDMVGHGRIVTIDVELHMKRPQHPRITYLIGSSVGATTVDEVRKLVDGSQSVLVILDSDHSMEHVLAELRLYSEFVTSGSYLIVEDSNVNGHPVMPFHGPGPMEAVRAFLKEESSFTIDRSQEKFFLTFNPNGYLRKQ